MHRDIMLQLRACTCIVLLFCTSTIYKSCCCATLVSCAIIPLSCFIGLLCFAQQLIATTPELQYTYSIEFPCSFKHNCITNNTYEKYTMIKHITWRKFRYKPYTVMTKQISLYETPILRFSSCAWIKYFCIKTDLWILETLSCISVS